MTCRPRNDLVWCDLLVDAQSMTDTERGTAQARVIGRSLTGLPVTDLQVIDEVGSAGSFALVVPATERLRGQRLIAHLGRLAQQRGLRLSVHHMNDMVIVLDADRAKVRIDRRPSCVRLHLTGTPTNARPEVLDCSQRSSHPSSKPNLRLINGGAADKPNPG